MTMSMMNNGLKLVGLVFIAMAVPFLAFAIAGLGLLSAKGILVCVVMGVLANYYKFFAWGRDDTNSKTVGRSLLMIFIACGVIATILSPQTEAAHLLVEFFGAIGLTVVIWFAIGVKLDKR